MTDHIERAAMSEPIDNQDPIERIESADPMLPTDATDPTLPIDRADPFDAMLSTESCDHSDHFDEPSSMARSVLPRRPIRRPRAPRSGSS